MERITRILDIYSIIDQQVAAFQLRTGLRCPTGCGICCPGAEVYTSSVEMLPAAKELLLQGHIQLWLERIQTRATSGLCAFFNQEELEKAGHCGLYAYRPAVCRLFGFSTIRDRRGNRILSTCRTVKSKQTAELANALEHQHEAPCLTDFSPLIIGIDPAAAHLVPINSALHQAILAVGLYTQFANSEKLTTRSAA